MHQSKGKKPNYRRNDSRHVIGKMNTCGHCSVYLAVRDKDNLVKIGSTINDVKHRQASLRNDHNDRSISIIEAFVGTWRDEQFLHKQLENRRVKDEWFYLQDLDLDYIREYFKQLYRKPKHLKLYEYMMPFKDYMYAKGYKSVTIFVPKNKVTYIKNLEITMRKELEKMIGTNLLKARLSADMTQKELGDTIGQQVASISRWENGHRTVTVDNLKMLCEALNVSADEILEINIK